ncbi:MAG: esterase-like activity of phytase family protein [Candidatus Parabeggiatoa sp. nov. 2]|nr:MAG: hypothetical protein B6247_20830 [Beggiatoa sp. 4572_84]RKZ63844.1 MAG: esterase-like activity of phytase family protein [Gammaproteobacteria bacterium]
MNLRHLRLFYTLPFAVFVVTMTGCDDDDVDDILDGSIIPDVTLSEEVIDVNEPLETVSVNGSKTLTLDVGVGSGAFHYPDDSIDEFYTITDRGPSIACDESAEVLGVENLCLDENGAVDENGKIFPMTNFTPTIYKFNINTGGLIGKKVGYNVIQTIKLLDQDENPISGLPNPLEATTTETPYNKNGNKLEFDPEGVDPEAIIRLSNGTFWIAEEYAPSLIHVAANGRILERVVPNGVGKDLAAANYRVIEALPNILTKRRLNRGIESLAVSPDEQFLYFIMQSPLANPNDDAYKNSRYVRLFKLSLHLGDLDSVVGEYVYIMDEPQTFTADNTTKQSDVKISEMVALDTDKLVILERVIRHTKLYRVSTLDDATNILGTEWDIEALEPSSPALETLSNLASIGIIALGKTQVFDSRREISDLDSQIEGLALLNSEYVAFINDNDFSKENTTTRITVAPIAKQLNQ